MCEGMTVDSKRTEHEGCLFPGYNVNEGSFVFVYKSFADFGFYGGRKGQTRYKAQNSSIWRYALQLKKL